MVWDLGLNLRSLKRPSFTESSLWTHTCQSARKFNSLPHLEISRRLHFRLLYSICTVLYLIHCCCCFLKQLFRGYKIALICVIIVTSSTKTKSLLNNKSFSNYGKKTKQLCQTFYVVWNVQISRFSFLKKKRFLKGSVKESLPNEVLVSEWAFLFLFFLIQSHTRCLHSHKLDTSQRRSLPGARLETDASRLSVRDETTPTKTGKNRRTAVSSFLKTAGCYTSFQEWIKGNLGLNTR